MRLGRRNGIPFLYGPGKSGCVWRHSWYIDGKRFLLEWQHIIERGRIARRAEKCAGTGAGAPTSVTFNKTISRRKIHSLRFASTCEAANPATRLGALRGDQRWSEDTCIDVC